MTPPADGGITVTCIEIPPHEVAKVTVKPGQKLLHLVRHGQATHNEFAASRIKEGEPCFCLTGRPNCPYLHPSNRDARLTQKGRLQATAAGSALARTGTPPELVIVSPLYRALQTASIALSIASYWLANTDRRQFFSKKEKAYHENGFQNAFLQQQQHEQQQKIHISAGREQKKKKELQHLQQPQSKPTANGSRDSSALNHVLNSSPMKTISTPTSTAPATQSESTTRGMPRIIVDPIVRERFGRHICDMRSPREQVEVAFRDFDFSAVPYGPDTEFDSMTEEKMDIANRGHRFFSSLRHRPETCIAVFTHSSFLFNTLCKRIECADPYLTRRFITAEVRTLLVSFS